MDSVAWATIFLAGVSSFVAYERLVRRQYLVAPGEWEAQGRPPGFLWSPPNSSVMRSWVRGRTYFQWIAETPEWMRADSTSLHLQLWLRASWLLGCVAWLWLVARLLQVI
jgi:hypothetical protein